MKFFVVSDVHSFYDEMIAALKEKNFELDNPEHQIIVCGDLFDRGPDARKTLDFMKRMHKEGRFHYVCGNHEELLFDCIQDIIRGRGISSHHYHNGTVDTIVQLTGINKYDLDMHLFDFQKFNEDISEVTDFISECAVDYVEIGDYIFVHGWVPAYANIEDFRNASADDWSQARWENGMRMWHNPHCRVPGKTVVCGHYHCSWGHSHLRQTHKEFPNKSLKNWKESFEPFIDKGIVAIDACTAYSGICNCWVLEV